MSHTLWVYLLDEVNAGLEVETKVDEIPFNALLAILLLLQDEHVVVEELLQSLVGQVDAKLLKGVHLEEEEGRGISMFCHLASSKQILMGGGSQKLLEFKRVVL